MSSICKTMMSGSYFEALQQRFPKLKPQDVWSLICCGSDLHHPYDGWAGVVACPVFDVSIKPFTLFFGDFSEQLMQWENVAEFCIERGTSKQQAFSDFRTYISSVSDNPVFVSANAATWALRVINDAVKLDTTGPWNAQLICLRDLYSTVVNKGELNEVDFIGQAFCGAAPLPKTFGLHKIAEALSVDTKQLGDKATHRAQLTAECTRKLLERQYPADVSECEG